VLEVTIDGEGVEWLKALQIMAAQGFEDTMHDWAKRELRPFVSRQVDATLRREPGPVVYPIEWASERQRRAFFATNGFGHGIPYRRTHRYAEGWRVEADYRGGLSEMSITNSTDYAEYIGGRKRQPFHANTGWADAEQVTARIIAELDRMIADGLLRVMDEELGV